MVKVYFESETHTEFAAIFPDEGIYDACLKILEALGRVASMKVTEDIDETQMESIVHAKEILEEKGFYTESLWSINDVKSKYHCDDSQAQAVLKNAFANEETYAQIWESIDCAADVMKLKEKTDEEKEQD